jgi:hypothetical protein
MYELWDAETRNVIRFFATVAEADAILTEHVRKHGPAVLDPLFLLHEDENEESTLIAEGQGMLVAIRRLVAKERATAESRRVG